MTNADSLRQGLARLQAEFAEKLPARMAEIASAHKAFAESQAEARLAALKELVGMAHKLAGSAGTYGYSDLGVAARALNDEGRAILNDHAPLDARAADRIAGLVDRMMALAGNTPPSGAPADSGSQAGTAPESQPAQTATLRAVWDYYLRRVPSLIYVPVLLVGLSAVTVGVYVDQLNEERFAAHQRTAVSDKLATIRSRLEGFININISLVKSMAVAIGAEPNLTQERFEALAAPLLSETAQLRNIGAAPDMVIRYMYPLKGNEAAIGLDLGTQPRQRDTALRARDTGVLVVAGPVELVQGGEALIGRMPVFVAGEPGDGKTFWGLLSAVIDTKRIYDAVGLLDNRQTIEIAIRGKDGLGSKGALFFGRAEVFESDPVLLSVVLPDGTWQIAAIPKGGWLARSDDAWVLRLGLFFVGSLIVLSLGAATWLFRQRLASIEALEASETRFRDLTRISSDWIWETGPDGRFTYLSDGFPGQAGYPKIRLLGKFREDFAVRVPGDEAAWEDLRRAIADRRSFGDFRYRYRRPDDALGWISIRGAPVFDADGSFRGYRGVAREVTQRMTIEDDLRKAKVLADTANRAKSDFLSNMSHELRTPLNAILGFAQLLQYNPKEPLTATQSGHIDIILRSGQHLLTLITEILDLARIEAGKITLTLDDVSIGALFGEVQTMLEPMAKKAKVKLNITAPEPDISVRGDLTRIKQVLLNLVSNAIKYNFEGGRVDVRAGMRPDRRFRVSVADTGAGISEAKQSEMFQPFNRLGAEATGIEGTGIGLALSKQLVEIMGGVLGYESKVGTGSTFWIELPLAADEGRSKRKADPGFSVHDLSPDILSLRGTVLYVEDNPDNFKLVELVFREITGISLLSADNAELGLRIAADRLPDVILMDISLPGMNGHQALERLKRAERTRAIPVIAVSANATKHDIDLGARSGFFRYLTKPIDVGQLLSTVREALGSRP